MRFVKRYLRHGYSGAALLCLLLGLLFASHPARATGGDPWASFDAPWFTTLDIAEGIPHSTTTAVVQDRAGLVWIGTIGGLVRYDGYRMEIFGVRGNGVAGLPDSYVRSLYALPDGGLLIGTNAGGLIRFDPTDNSFTVYPVGPGGLADHKIYAISSDHAGGVWVATEGGLDHLDLASGSIRRVATGTGTSPRNFSVLQDRAGNLWLGNNNGLFVRHLGSDAFVAETSTDQNANTVLHDQIWSLLQDREGRLWAGSVQAGASWRDDAGQWHEVPGFSGYPNSERHATVRDILQVAPDTVWIATDGNGVIEYSAGEPATRTIAHDPAVHSSLPGDSVRSLLLDRTGNLWAATDLGVARTHPGRHTAFSLYPSPLNPDALSAPNVRNIFVDTRKRIWLGLASGHIDVLNLQAGSISHLRLAGSQLQRGIHTITEAADGSIFVGTQGLARIDPDTLIIQNSILPELRDKPVLSLHSDGQRMVLGTYDGIYRYDLRTHALEHVSHQAGKPDSLISNTVRQIVRIGTDWWYATSRGISIAHGDSLPASFQNLLHRNADASSLPQDYISSLIPDATGRIWASTLAGIGLLERQDGGSWAARTINTSNGLSSDNVNAVLPDSRGNLWASLSNGVSRIDGQTLAVSNLGARDGLHIASYVSIAAAVAPGGELLFGGQSGLTVIRPDWTPVATTAATLAVTNAVINNHIVPFASLPENGHNITLNDDTHNMRFSFALLDYQAPMETTYQYKLEGFDHAWNDISKGSAPVGNYTNLPHGNYTLRLSAMTHGLQPRTIETRIAVTVSPYWYETTRARIAAVLLLLALIALLVHLRTLYLRHQARRLQDTIDQHTYALVAANRRLDELASTDSLTGVYNRRRFLELVRQTCEQSPEAVISLALFDLDRFKLVNDTYGHQAGDSVIVRAVEVINRHCRHTDLIGRYGGEEFVLCLPQTSKEQAHEIIERIRNELALMTLMHEGMQVMITASIGIAQRLPDESFERWLSRTDEALYRAKRSGRNCSAIAS
ncbi:diguanylate cyclase [Rhodanobacter sp. AS-Z3]|uniref:ligand-binding sensor domain-containing diguanylate cyclase n=1 Tax=Rhodanobacter sp. AS-Z3 TaxID=3031330 RepID=UPI00247A9D4B|nr:ligand-binding sensor domain-containing diguanylate cyclase [Rhodanobacter sp. AS-Z3]WEN16875.1 diguanylate cyclase [Rhodanobacter sp. AS-Z3]